MQFYLSSETWKYLTLYFCQEDLLLPSIDQLCLCRTYLGVAALAWEWGFWNSGFDVDFVEDIDREEMDNGQGWILWPAQGFLYNEFQSGLRLLEDMDSKIRESLVFKDHIMKAARQQVNTSVRKWMSKNKKRVKREGITKNNVTLVGIHHRRGDHLKFEQVMKIPHITMSYLSPSMDMYRDKYKNAVFLYVSDDKEWAKQHLTRDKELVFSWSLSAKVISTGEDLAILSLCTHTIMTRGTYSFWASKLAGGTYIRPCMFQHTATQQEQEKKRQNGKPWPGKMLNKQWQTSLWREC